MPSRNNSKSCGVLIEYNNKFLIGHASGQKNNYGIPKGGQEEGEDDKTTALRELYEETNIQLQPEDLSDIPFLKYRAKSGKYIVVFRHTLQEEPKDVFCHSTVEGTGRQEFDYFVWLTKEEARLMVKNHMREIFKAL